MNQLQMFKAGILLAVSIVLTGCATSRSEIKLSEPEEFGTGIQHAVERGWLELHESGTFVRLNQG